MSGIQKMIGVFPLTCNAYLQTRARGILETWGAHVGDSLIFLGDDDVKVEGFTQLDCIHPEEAHPGRTENAYEDAPHKLFNALRRIAYDSTYQWCFFCDDDTYIKVERLMQYVSSKSTDNVCIYAKNQVGNYPQDESLQYPSGGAGWLVSMETLQKIIPHLDNVPMSIPDRWCDVMLGFALQTAGIPIIDDGVFYDRTPEDEWSEWQWSHGQVNKQPGITYHNLEAPKMRKFHNAYFTSCRDVLLNWCPEYTEFIHSKPLRVFASLDNLNEEILNRKK